MTDTLMPRRSSDRSMNRPIPERHIRPRQYRYPSQRADLPGVCGHCGAKLLLDDRPTAEHVLVDLACWLCSRVACELLYDGFRTAPMTTPSRPPKHEPARSLPPKVPLPCTDCDERAREHQRTRCRPCRQGRSGVAHAD